MSDYLQLHGLQSTKLLYLWDSPSKNTGVGSHSLLQGIFLTQGSNLGLPHYRQILYDLSHQESLYSIYLSAYCLLIPTRLTPITVEIFLFVHCCSLSPLNSASTVNSRHSMDVCGKKEERNNKLRPYKCTPITICGAVNLRTIAGGELNNSGIINSGKPQPLREV